MKTLMLIDLSAIYWASWHASADEHLSTAYIRTVEKVHSLRDGYDFSAVCMDAPPYFRKELLPTYKAQRDAPAEDAIEQLQRVKERLDADGLLLWSVRGFEADDIIATATKHAVAAGMRVTIASSDKDLMQLIDDMAGVSLHSLRDGQAFGEAAVVEKFGVPPHKMRDLLALVGDTSDNVPGVEKVGVKTAAKLLADYGSLDGVFTNTTDVKQPKLREYLQRDEPAARLARRLVTLRDDAPIDFQDLHKTREVKPLVTEEPEDMDAPETVTADGELISSPEASPAPATPAQDTEAPTPANMAMVKAADWSMGLEPASLGSAMKLAQGLANSRIYTRFPNAEAIWAVIIRGREMGLGALTALDSFHIIEGKPSPSAHLLIARCKAHPDCEYFQFVGGDATFAEYETKNRRNPRPTRLKYTIEQAKAAGLLNPTKSGQPSNWEKRPDEMLRKTCAVQLGRIEYPEATGGLYAIEELGGVAA